MDSPPPKEDIDHDWLRTWYAISAESVRWNKAQSWSAVNWTIALLGAILVASEKLSTINPSIWIGLVIVVWLSSMFWITSLHISAKSERNTGEKIAAVVPGRDYFLPPRGSDHEIILVAKCILLTLAAAGVVWQIVC